MAFILENIIVFLKFMLNEAIPKIPRWIELRLKKEQQARILNEENLRNALSHVAKKDDDNVLLIKEEKELKHVYDNGNKIQPVYISKDIIKSGECVPLLKVD